MSQKTTYLVRERRLRELLLLAQERQHLTTRELADALDISEATLSRKRSNPSSLSMMQVWLLSEMADLTETEKAALI